MTQVQALLFDVDGTIALNAEEIHKNCVKQTLAENYARQSIDFDEQEFERIWKKNLGGGIKPFFADFLKEHGDLRTTPKNSIFKIDQKLRLEQAAILEKEYLGNYLSSQEVLKLREGVTKMLELSKTLGIPVFAISNATQVVLEHTLTRVLEVTGYGMDDFKEVAGQDKIKQQKDPEGKFYQVKPYGGSYMYICHKYGLDPAHCWGFEDSFKGYLSLDHAGVGTRFWCQNEGNDSFDKQAADFFNNPKEEFNQVAAGYQVRKPTFTTEGDITEYADMMLEVAGRAVEHHLEEQNSSIGGAPASNKKIVHEPSFM